MRKVDRRQIAYTGYAPQYDARRFRGRRNEYIERIRLRGVLECVGGVDSSARILDVGAGTGRGPVALATAGFRNVVGVDFTEAMLVAAREKIDALPHPGAVRLVRGDAFTLPFPDESFDVVLSLKFFHMFRFELQQEIMREMARVCRRGGLVIVELQSIHKGLFVTRYPEQWRERDHQKFNSITEVRRLFSADRFASRRIIGTVLPKMSGLFSRVPALGERVESISLIPPFNWLSTQVVVRGRRR